MAWVEDRWISKRTGQRTTRYGTGLRYRARWTGPDGTEASESFPDKRKREAQEYADAQEAAVKRGTWVDPHAGRMTLARFTETVYLPSLTQNPTTRERVEYQWRLHIKPELGRQQLGYLAAHPSVVQQWVRGLTMAASSAKVVLDVLSGIFAAALDDQYINRNPVRTKSVRVPKAERRRVVPWTAAQVAGVRGGLPGRYRALVDCGSELGMRQGEAFGFASEDIEWLRHTVHVRRQVKFAARRQCLAPPKGGRERDVPLSEYAQYALAAHIEQFPPVAVTLPWLNEDFIRWVTEDGPAERVRWETVHLIFTTPTGKAIRRGNFDCDHWPHALRAAGMTPGQDKGMHALRHYFASVLVAGGVSIREVSEYLGHQSVSVTLDIYAHLMPDSEVSMREALAAARKSTNGPRTARDA